MPAESDVLLEASCFVRQWLREQPGVKEESLTDWLLYKISKDCPRFTYHAFTRHSEGRETGADWEWWIIFRKNLSFRLRIQAKKLRPGKDHYSAIAQANQHGLQIEMLLSACEKPEVKALPFYAFYASASKPTMCASAGAAEGVFLAGAKQIFSEIIKPGRNSVPPDVLLAKTTPLSCLLGCPLVRPTETGLLLFLKNYYPHENKVASPPVIDATLPGVHTQIPDFVLALLASEDLDSWESDFDQLQTDIKALAVLDLRDAGVNPTE